MICITPWRSVGIQTGSAQSRVPGGAEIHEVCRTEAVSFGDNTVTMDQFTLFGFTAFLVTIGIDILVHLGDDGLRYERRDTLTNLGLGILASLLGTAARGFYLLAFGWLNSVALFSELGPLWLQVPLCFLGSELAFYLFHRAGHEVRFFWAAHATHHSSTRFNFSTALCSPVHCLYRHAFWCPLALIGFDPVLIILCDAATLFYSFFLHTPWKGDTRWMELVMNTPSLHRVHHARNPRYLNKNMGGALIIFDRLFGTFQAENEAPEYGITEPLRTDGVFQVALDGYLRLFHAAARQHGAWNALRHVMGSLGKGGLCGEPGSSEQNTLGMRHHFATLHVDLEQAQQRSPAVAADAEMLALSCPTAVMETHLGPTVRRLQLKSHARAYPILHSYGHGPFERAAGFITGYVRTPVPRITEVEAVLPSHPRVAGALKAPPLVHLRRLSDRREDPFRGGSDEEVVENVGHGSELV